MIVERNIGGIEVDVETTQANELYFMEDFVAKIEKWDIGGITDAIYNNRTVDSEILPISVFIELTNRCNFACPFCYINEGKEYEDLPTFEELKNTFDYLIDKGMLYCTLSGGECLIRSDFRQIYLYLKQRGVLVTVFTNGYMLTDELISMFCEYKPFKVEISIYGHDDKSYNLSTACENICADKVFDNILKLRNKDVYVVCKTPITKLTENSYKYIKSWCKSNELEYYNGIELMNSYSGEDRNDYVASEDVRDEIRQKSEKDFFDNKEMMKVGYSEYKNKRSFECAAGRTEVFISYKFKLHPCMKAVNIEEWQFDIATMGIENAYEEMVEKILKVKGSVLQYCKGCIHHQVCQECFMTKYEYDNLKEHRVNYCKKLADFMHIE